MFAPGVLLALSLEAGLARGEDFQGSTHALPFEDEVIHYSLQTPEDPIAHLQRRIDAGEVKLAWDDKFGYLPGVLDALAVPKASQMLVFSKTSLQRREITPKNPRALFYNDDVYVGYIPGAPLMELSAIDPTLGGIFYSIEQEKVRRPKFRRDADCLRCHGTGRSLGVPGPILRSIGTDETGEIDTQNETEQVNHCTPLAERWGGWYVTGQHGSQPHRGNLIGAAAFARHATEPNAFGNLTELSPFFDPSNYPATGSDIGALMVLEHQSHMHNYLTRLHYETRLMVATYGHTRYLKNQVNAFLRYLLFTEETPLTGPIVADAAFVREFVARGPRDRRGRSLRDLDLQTRMFKYPCSFLIYSPAFDQLPDAIREPLLRRLWDILNGADPDPQFAKIAPADRQAILEILRETKPGLPAYWRAS